MKLVLFLIPFLGRRLVAMVRKWFRPKRSDPLLVTDNFLAMREARVSEVRRPTTVEQLQDAVKSARDRKLPISMMGVGHNSDGHQFAEGAVHLDMRGMNRVLGVDEGKGVALVEGGVTWEQLVLELQRRGSPWGIHVKQTLLNKATVAGSVSVNIHGRKMNSAPLVRYVRSVQLVDAEGRLRTVSREQDRELFSLVVGGYGGFGIIAAVEVELQRTRNVERDVIPKVPIDEVAERYLAKMSEGYVYGDAHSNGTGIVKNWAYLTMYKPTDALPALLPFKSTPAPPFLYTYGMYLLHRDQTLPLELWRSEMEKAGLHSTTDSCQFTTLGDYYEDIHGGALGFEGNDMHVEFQVDPEKFREVIQKVRGLIADSYQACTFCDLRFVRKDTETFLNYAKRDFFTFSPTFHMEPANEAEIRALYHRLFDLVVDQYGGSFYLWDYFMGRPEHYLRAYPQLRDFVRLRKQYDPDGVFSSLWLKKLEALVAATPG